jgi:hypothetical protein
MPCRVSSDVHEWNNEDLAVPTWGPVNLPLGEKAKNFQRGEKTPWSFTAACCWNRVMIAECKWEPLYPRPSGAWGRRQCNTTLSWLYFLPEHQLWNNGRWAVRLGRHALEKVSRAPKSQLRRVRNPP